MTTEKIESKCIEIRRLESIDRSNEELREDIKEIRDGFSGLTAELHKLSVSLFSNAEIIKSILIRFEDRDKQLHEIAATNRETFNRFGNKIDSLDDRIRKAEEGTQKVSSVERITYGLLAGIGALVLFYIQQRMS